MNKKKKIANKKHRKNQARLHALHVASLKKAKKKAIVKPVKEESPDLVESANDIQAENKKGSVKKTPKKATAKKATAKKTTAKKTTAKKTTAKKKSTKK